MQAHKHDTAAEDRFLSHRRPSVAGRRIRADNSIRTDVSLWDNTGTSVIAIYDLKTGGARLSNARAEQLRNGVTQGADKPIVFELRIKRN